MVKPGAPHAPPLSDTTIATPISKPYPASCSPQPSTPTLKRAPLFLFVFPVELARLLWQIYNSGVKVFRQQQINLTPPPPPPPPPHASPSPDKKTHSEHPPCTAPTQHTAETPLQPFRHHFLLCVKCFFKEYGLCLWAPTNMWEDAGICVFWRKSVCVCVCTHTGIYMFCSFAWDKKNIGHCFSDWAAARHRLFFSSYFYIFMSVYFSFTVIQRWC